MIDMAGPLLPFRLSQVNYSMPGIKPLDLNSNTTGLAVGTGFALGTEPPLAGRYAEAVSEPRKKTATEKMRETLEAAGIDPNTPMGGMFALNLINKYEEQDIDKLKEQGEYFFDLMQRNADRAQERAKEATIIAGLVDLPNQFEKAMDRRYTFFPETLQMVRENVMKPSYFSGNTIAQYL